MCMCVFVRVYAHTNVSVLCVCDLVLLWQTLYPLTHISNLCSAYFHGFWDSDHHACKAGTLPSEVTPQLSSLTEMWSYLLI